MFEVFINNGKSGSDLMALADALGRMISFVLRIHSPVPAKERVREIVSELSGIGGARSVGFGENRVRSLPDAVAKVLAKHCNFRVNGKVEDRPVPTITESSSNNGAALNGQVSGMSNGHTLNGKVSSEGAQLSLPHSSDAETVTASTATTSLFDICPSCGSGTLAYEEGCKKCYGCGYSEC